MQPNVVTLTAPKDGVSTSFEYSRYEETQNRSVYIAADHLPDARNMFTVTRSFPTRNGNFKGVGKTSVKFTEDRSIAGVDSSSTLTAPTIIEVSFSVPVGMNVSHVSDLRERVRAILADSSFMDALNVQLVV